MISVQHVSHQQQQQQLTSLKFLLQASKYLDENSRYEVLELLGHLEGELQAKDVAIATLKVSLANRYFRRGCTMD